MQSNSLNFAHHSKSTRIIEFDFHVLLNDIDSHPRIDWDQISFMDQIFHCRSNVSKIIHIFWSQWSFIQWHGEKFSKIRESLVIIVSKLFKFIKSFSRSLDEKMDEPRRSSYSFLWNLFEPYSISLERLKFGHNPTWLFRSRYFGSVILIGK